MKYWSILFSIICCLLLSQSTLADNERHSFELVIKISNLPNPNQVTSITAQNIDVIYDDDYDPTNEWSGGTIVSAAGSQQEGFDWFLDPQTAQVALAYSRYNISCFGAEFIVNYYDCDYAYPAPDIYFEYDYSDGNFYYHGTRIDPENRILLDGDEIPIWYIHPEYPNYDPDITCFQNSVTFKNKFQTYELFGRLVIDDNIYVDSGDDLDIWKGREYNEKPEYQRYLDVGSVSENDVQHHYWNNTESNYFIENDFIVSPTSQTEIAQFKILKPCTIRAEYSGASGGKAGFKDPWLIEQDGSQPGKFHFYNSPYIPSDGYGAFLNQDPNEKPVFYSVKVPEDTTITFHNDDIDFYFQNWSGTNVDFDDIDEPQTAIVFTQSGAVATAEYKGHLATNTTTAISLNNQRKMAFDGQTYHMAYEDNGEIYYTYSDDDGDTWSKEERISDGGGDNKFPSIDTYVKMDEEGEDIIEKATIVVWQDESANIFLRAKVDDEWNDKRVVRVPIAQGDNATPVVAKGQEDGVFVVVWHDFAFDNLSVRGYNYHDDSFGAIDDIPETNEESMYPSMTSDYFYNQHLAWEESGDVYYSEFDYIDGEYNSNIDRECVSEGSGYFSQHVYPSITTDYGRPDVSWQAFNGPLQIQSILHRRRGTNDWGSATAFADQGEWRDYYKPSITSFPNISKNEELRIAWRRSDNKIWVAVYNGSSWDDFSQSVNGFDPNLSSNISDDNEMVKMVYRGASSNPYILTTTSDGLIYSPQFLKPTSAKVVHRRCGVLTLGKSSIAFELGEFQIDGNPVELFPYSDTLIVGNTGRWEEMFRTESFQVSGQSSLSYFRGFTVAKRDTLKNILPKGVKIKLNLEVVNAQSGQVISIPDIQTITSNVPPNSREFKDVLFNLSGTQEVFLRVGLNLPKGIAMKQSMVEVYCIEDSAANFQKPLSEETTVPIINKPVHFKLGNNYPNPFNPTTTIAFDLAHDSFVELEIYDISGRKVETLISNDMQAGSHHVIWDGSNELGRQISSGVYFYRIRAGQFTAVNKMMLLR